MGNLSPAPVGYAGPTTQVWTTPFPHHPGEKARDNQGNEFLFVDFIGTAYNGILVSISEANEATPLLGTARLPSRVGVAMTGATSDNGGWVQIYGVHWAVQVAQASGGGTSDNTVAYLPIPQTTVNSPSGALALFAANTTASSDGEFNQIFGMWVMDLATVSNFSDWPAVAGDGTSTSNASGAVTVDSAGASSATSYIGSHLPVFLNYPYVNGVSLIADASSD